MYLYVERPSRHAEPKSMIVIALRFGWRSSTYHPITVWATQGLRSYEGEFGRVRHVLRLDIAMHYADASQEGEGAEQLAAELADEVE